ncbi:Zinc finger CCHC-type, partial [Trinorchestia longiramus]
VPPYVRRGYQQYRVNTYIGKPWYCYKCQRFGHSASFCRSAPRCVVCNGPHTSNECNTTTGQICCNCGGNHTANYGGCPKIKRAKEVEKT